jgi:hypothetical protein
MTSRTGFRTCDRARRRLDELGRLENQRRFRRGVTQGRVNGGVYTDRTRTDQGTGTRTTSSSVIPAGQEIDVRLESELSSETAQVEQRFQATTVADLYRGDQVLIPAGSTVRGIISSVNRPRARTEREV